MDVPPSRYRVVERGRRLVVLDTHNGNQPVVRAPPPAPAPRSASMTPPAAPGPASMARRARLEAEMLLERGTQEQVSEDLKRSLDAIRAGKADPVFETQRWYDDRAPRKVRIRQGGGGGGFGIAIIAIFFVVMIGLVSFGWPMLVFAGFILLQSWKTIRRSITRWLDKQEQA